MESDLDTILLRQISEGSSQALSQLYQSYAPRLLRFVIRMTQDAEIAAEVVNDVFLVVWRKAAAFRGDSSLSTWLIGIAYRSALKALRRRSPVTSSLEAVNGEALTAANETETAMDFDRLVSVLSPEQRAVMELTYYHGYTYREIAEILDCPENTVKTRMFHARTKIRNAMEA